MHTIRLGCSGWFYEDWKGVFYKTKKGMLSYYAKIFDTVEINSTFYQIPKKPFMAHGWVKHTPDDFIFAVKFPRLFTHKKKTRCQLTEDDLEPFIQNVLHPLDQGKKLGPILIQFPFSFSVNYLLLEELFSSLPIKYSYTVEFRHPTWLEDQNKTMTLLSKYNIAYCIVSEKILPPITEITSSFAYIRWHGLNEPKDQRYLRYNYLYTEEQLEEWASVVKDLADEVTVYGYFNNHPNGQAPANCNQIKTMLGLKPKVPQQSLDRYLK
ncbi:MAG: DUF72 domain-containing protein [Candidatus Helarchaeota archaeon]